MSKLISSVIAFLITIVSVFPNQINKPTTNQTTILFTGDIMLGRSVMNTSLNNNDSYYPFRKTSEVLKNADITFGNLENPIIKDCKKHTGGFTFCTTPEIAKGLNFAGIDVVTLANNHTNNYGVVGINETKKYLTDMNINYVGDSNLIVKEANGIKFGFLGFNYTFSKNSILNDLILIKDSDPQVDVLIVSPHWGEEYKEKANKFQTETAKKMIENGADVIIGHHPHWVQNFEEVDGKPVYYSLGNFIFDQMWSEETKKGLVVKMTFDPPAGETGAKLTKTEEFKTYIPKIGQPEIIK